MLQLEIPTREFFDEDSSSFVVYTKESLQVEHSLVSLSKWESKWCKPFLSQTPKTHEEMVDYIRCMTIAQNVKPETLLYLPQSTFDAIDAYINAPMTATWFNDNKTTSKGREIITSELIYYWMVSHSIPFECQKWHLNRLLTLIRVCNIKNQPQKKQSQKEMLANRTALNQSRKSQYQTKG